MTQKGWTHITIPEDFADELRETATKEGLPIWRYIKNSMNDGSSSTLCGGNQARPKVIDSRVLSVLESVLSSSIFHNENNIINQEYVNISELEITEFERYLKIRKGLSDSTVKLYFRLFRQFVKIVRKESVTSRDVEDYLIKSRSKRNDLANK